MLSKGKSETLLCEVPHLGGGLCVLDVRAMRPYVLFALALHDRALQLDALKGPRGQLDLCEIDVGGGVRLAMLARPVVLEPSHLYQVVLSCKRRVSSSVTLLWSEDVAAIAQSMPHALVHA